METASFYSQDFHFLCQFSGILCHTEIEKRSYYIFEVFLIQFTFYTLIPEAANNLSPK